VDSFYYHYFLVVSNMHSAHILFVFSNVAHIYTIFIVN
jgi:hypothetical protein